MASPELAIAILFIIHVLLYFFLHFLSILERCFDSVTVAVLL